MAQRLVGNKIQIMLTTYLRVNSLWLQVVCSSADFLLFVKTSG